MIALLLAALATAQAVGVRVEVQPLGRGVQGTVMGVAFQVAPEDRERVGERVEVVVALLVDGKLVDRNRAVVALAGDGSGLLYREWPVGKGELRFSLAALDGAAQGAWTGPVDVPQESTPFEPAEDAPPDALALAVTPPAAGGVRFLPPPRIGGIGALQLAVEAPEGTSRVEFFQDGARLVQRNRPPWTVSVTLGEVAQRTTIRAVAYGERDRFVGEDALVLNGPADQLQVAILLGPDRDTDSDSVVTVSVGGGPVEQVVLRLDDEPVNRWLECPCQASLSKERLAMAKILTAEALGKDGRRGEAVWVTGQGGFVDEVRVDQVELPVVVFDGAGRPVTDLKREEFRVWEDGQEMTMDSFATTADLPLNLGILVDTSRSMTDTFAAVREAVAGFASGLLRPGDSFFLMTFSFEPTLEVPWTGDPRLVEISLERVVPDGGTSLHDAMVRALELFRSRRGRTALVVLTDGDDTTSRTGWDAALRFCRTVRTPIFPIGFRISSLGFFIKDRLKEIAEVTGGQVFYAKRSENLNDAYHGISEQLRSQYLLSYRSPSTQGSDHFREVRVQVLREGLEPRTIAGYYPGW